HVIAPFSPGVPPRFDKLTSGAEEQVNRRAIKAASRQESEKHPDDVRGRLESLCIDRRVRLDDDVRSLLQEGDVECEVLQDEGKARDAQPARRGIMDARGECDSVAVARINSDV